MESTESQIYTFAHNYTQATTVNNRYIIHIIVTACSVNLAMTEAQATYCERCSVARVSCFTMSIYSYCNKVMSV